MGISLAIFYLRSKPKMSDQNLPEEKESDETKPTNKFAVQRIYSSKGKYKLSHAPQVFKGEWKPKIEMEIQAKNEKIEENVFNVNLAINVTAKNNNMTAFTAEVKQGGIFQVEGFDEEQIKQILQANAADILFPYASKKITDMSIDATLPPIILQPISFTAVYAQQKQKEQKDKQTQETENEKIVIKEEDIATKH